MSKGALDIGGRKVIKKGKNQTIALAVGTNAEAQSGMGSGAAVLKTQSGMGSGAAVLKTERHGQWSCCS
jgi:hypothetical protein